MTRFLAIVMMCAFVSMVACSSSDDDTADSGFKGDLDPTAISLDNPPTNGKLPADLRPPA